MARITKGMQEKLVSLLLRDLPRGTPELMRARVLTQMTRSFAAVNQGALAAAAREMRAFRTAVGAIPMRRRSGRGVGRGPWETCADACNQYMLAGNPALYAACYWSCVAAGGPKNKGRTRVESLPR